MNAYFLSWFFNVVTIHIRMLRGRRLLLDGNRKGYEVAEHIVKKVEINPHMLSILKNEKYILSMTSAVNFLDISDRVSESFICLGHAKDREGIF